MSKQGSLIFILVLLFGIASAQTNAKIDSLKKELQAAQNGTITIQLLNKIANAYRISGEYNNAKSYLNDAFILVEKTQWEYGEALTYNNLIPLLDIKQSKIN